MASTTARAVVFSWISPFLLSVWAQQLNGTYMNIDYPGLGTECKTALNTSVACPLFLSQRAYSGGILDLESVNALCTDDCRSSLESAESTIKAACQASTDTIELDVGTKPASYIIQSYIYAYDISCRKDAVTGDFCDPSILAWSEEPFLGANESCSDCWLGSLSDQLNNPLGWDEPLASNFQSLTSSCSATGEYSVTNPVPTTSLPDPSTSTTPLLTPDCAGSYTLTTADLDCNAVAKQLGVSTYNLLVANQMDLYCQAFPSAADAGETLCVPETCTTYTWKAHDSCAAVVIANEGMTMAQLLAWNPNFNTICSNSDKFVGYEICISPPGGDLPTATGAPLPGNDITSPVPAPTNGEPDSTSRCGRWYTIQNGDECSVLSVNHGLTLADFYLLNPGVDANCTNLVLGVAYCVAPVGDISTYPGYPTTTRTGIWATITVPPVTFSDVNTQPSLPSSDPGYVYTSSLLPTAAGTQEGCEVYRNYVSDQSKLNSCVYVAFAYDTSVEQLIEWNPSLDEADCALQSGYSYCVNPSNGEPEPSQPPYCIDLEATEPDTAADCNCFTRLKGYQSRSGLDCNSIVSTLPITIEDLVEWNPWLGSTAECATNLFAGLEDKETRAVCIGTGSTTEPTTTAAGTTSTTSESSPSTDTQVPPGTSEAPPAPTPSGVIDGCQEYYVVQSGDYCYLIAENNGITLEDFYAWNPSVGSDCETLMAGYAYCVKGPD